MLFTVDQTPLFFASVSEYFKILFFYKLPSSNNYSFQALLQIRRLLSELMLTVYSDTKGCPHWHKVGLGGRYKAAGWHKDWARLWNTQNRFFFLPQASSVIPDKSFQHFVEVC